jgi:hypothetical protein
MDNPMTDAGELGLTADMDGAAVVNRRDRALVIIAGDRPLDEVRPCGSVMESRDAVPIPSTSP